MIATTADKSNCEDKIAALSENLREAIISEIAMRSGFEGIVFAADLACADKSASVKVGVVEALQFRRADRFVTKILQGALEDVWAQLAKKGYSGAIADPECAERLRRERVIVLRNEIDPIARLRLMRYNDETPNEAEGQEVAAAITSPDFPSSDQHAYAAVMDAFERYPEQTADALINRLKAGLEIPYRTSDILKAKSYALDEPIAGLVFNLDEHDKLAAAAAAVIGPHTIGRLLDRVTQIADAALVAGKWNEEGRREYFALQNRICATQIDAFADTILNRTDRLKPEEIGLMADLLARHGQVEFGARLSLEPDRQEPMTRLLQTWAEALLTSTESTRGQMANVARVVSRFPRSTYVPVAEMPSGGGSGTAEAITRRASCWPTQRTAARW